MKVSVALAAYKGERYIEAQISSILPQLSAEDEIIISDDCPGSDMSKVINCLYKEEPRIHYVEGPSKGVIRNFENAIKQTTGDLIFLCDQDDVWLPDKVQLVKKEFENGAILVLHDASVTDADLNVEVPSFFKIHESKPGYLNNILKNSYMGCCMAFDASLKKYILPFPKNLPMHDQYIGLIAERLQRNGMGRIDFLETPLILYRQHGNNVTGGKTTLANKIKWRVNILCATWRKQLGK